MHIESNRAFDAYESIVEVVYVTMWINVKYVRIDYVHLCKTCVLVMVIKCEYYVSDLVIKKLCEYLLYSCDDDLRVFCIY